jgi:hypothetical protein
MRFFTVIAAILIAFQSSGQQAEVIPGEVLFQLTPNARPEKVQLEFQAAAGILPDFKVQSCISQPMRAWLGTFDHTQISLDEVIATLKTIAGVSLAQANHKIESRAIPNDPFFGNQWHHQQANDKDIDTDLAWDITTGGTTAFGDDIVVCVVEPNGTKWDQPDILPNHWVNEGEIPNNGIDDDDNGYVDDYDGYNVTNGTDNISTGNHGTQVSSMIGAKGNNETGITGVNWDVKLMQVQLGNVSEANVVAAYTYPLVMRRLYNETGGERGALVVATNSSWGTDNGQPSNAPLWCAMYDSLGYYGILSCGATANNNVNIDVVGDLPTACPSEFMIAVTATNNNDVRTFSGYGQTTIDLGAPGADVYLAGNTSYGNTSGTSFASPCVAGAIALLYSAPCASFAAIFQADPAMAAQMIRDYIYDGTDAVSNLTTETVTGGRLNVRNSLDLLLAECSNDVCIAPFGLISENGNAADEMILDWTAIPGSELFNLRYREEGAAQWTTISNLISSDAVLTDLLACTVYEAQAQTVCDNGESDWSNSHSFTSQGCCENPQSGTVTASSGTSVTAQWNAVLSAQSYQLTLIGNDSELIVDDVQGTSYLFTGLSTCASYTLEIATNCENGAAENVLILNIHTGGCEDCSMLTYCNVSAGANSEWIEQVVIADLTNTTESDGGFADFTDQPVDVTGGETYPISCTPGFSGFAYSEYFRVWADWNSDGEFGTNEVLFDPGNSSTAAVSGSFTVPLDVTPGHIRVRVSMSYYGTFGGGALPVACGSIEYGEVEDYCLNVSQEVSVAETDATAFQVFPNPSSGAVNVLSPASGAITVYDASGRLVNTFRVNSLQQEWISGLEPGWYLFHFTDSHGKTGRRKVVVQ